MPVRNCSKEGQHRADLADGFAHPNIGMQGGRGRRGSLPSSSKAWHFAHQAQQWLPPVSQVSHLGLDRGAGKKRLSLGGSRKEVSKRRWNGCDSWPKHIQFHENFLSTSSQDWLCSQVHGPTFQQIVGLESGFNGMDSLPISLQAKMQASLWAEHGTNNVEMVTHC